MMKRAIIIVLMTALAAALNKQIARSARKTDPIQRKPVKGCDSDFQKTIDRQNKVMRSRGTTRHQDNARRFRVRTQRTQ